MGPMNIETPDTYLDSHIYNMRLFKGYSKSNLKETDFTMTESNIFLSVFNTYSVKF